MTKMSNQARREARFERDFAERRRAAEIDPDMMNKKKAFDSTAVRSTGRRKANRSQTKLVGGKADGER